MEGEKKAEGEGGGRRGRSVRQPTLRGSTCLYLS